MRTAQEVSLNNNWHSCWVIINDQVCDLTQFLDEHPGGPGVILQYAGKDATAVYEAIHPPGTIDQLPQDKHLGPLDTSTGDRTHSEAAPTAIQTPHLHTLQNLDDFEIVAKDVLNEKAWAYYTSAAESLCSVKRNLEDWAKVSFRPRVLRNVARVSLRRRIMGHNSSLPVFIAPAALARLGHPDGELCLARAAVSSYSSVSHQDVATCCKEEKRALLGAAPRFGQGALAFQLYLPLKKKQGGRELIAKAKALGYQALVVTVDTPVVGKREADERLRARIETSTSDIRLDVQNTTEPGSDAPVLRGAHSSTLDWDDLHWIRAAWGPGPLIITGIQTAEDALRASNIGVQGIYLSNHGGRQLDHAPSALQTLLEIRSFCPQVLSKVEVYLDGGVPRGTDVVKALCLGATGVGLGRPFLYALSGYGTDGVVKALQILSDEIESTLRLLGVVDIAELKSTLVNTAVLGRDLAAICDLGARKSGLKL
ncbi:FMN-dependent dehydrogenase-domain-containing protein [Aspergillus unguis]